MSRRSLLLALALLVVLFGGGLLVLYLVVGYEPEVYAQPISGRWLVEDVAKAGRESGSGLAVTWYRHNGHPVALLRFQADQAHPTLLLQDVHLDKGSLTIRGRSPEAALHSLLLNFPDG